MGVFFKASEKQSLKDRNNLFKEDCISILERQGFVGRPFKTSWLGEYYKEIGGYIYDFGRVSKQGFLEHLKIRILKDDDYIKITLNIFKMEPKLISVSELNNFEGTKFFIPPNSTTEMELRSDDYKGPPLFYMLFLPEHKIGKYYTKSGYNAEINKLKKLINSDMEIIDSFIKTWYKLHKPNITDWEGNIIKKNSQALSGVKTLERYK